MYACAECGRAVIVVEGHAPIKACECEAAILATASVSLAGAGRVE
jgi:hypothetical protein